MNFIFLLDFIVYKEGDSGAKVIESNIFCIEAFKAYAFQLYSLDLGKQERLIDKKPK